MTYHGRGRRRGSIQAAWKFFLLSCILIFVKLQLDAGDEVLRAEEADVTIAQTVLATPVMIDTSSQMSLVSNPDLAFQHHNFTSNLILHVQTWREGMAGWRRSLANLQVAAKQLNAMVVEPEILNGRLVGNEPGNVRLMEVMDPSNFHPNVSWIRPEELHQLVHASPSSSQRQQSVITMHLCLDLCDPTKFAQKECKPRKAPLPCSIPGHNSSIPSDYRKQKSMRLQRAMDHAARGETVILQIHEFWKDGLSQMQVMVPAATNDLSTRYNETRLSVPIVLHDGPEAERLRSQFEFQPRLYALADKALEQLGVPTGQLFHTIHWRAELATMNYTECALRILHAQEQMMKAAKELLSSPSSTTTSDNSRFLLLSSLSTNRSRIWRNDAIYADDSQRALSMLLSGSNNASRAFLKVDQVYESLGLRDPIESAAIDLILAQKSSQFATCTSDCGRNCLQCNHAGFFALLAMSMRTKQQKESFACWPKEKKVI